MAFPRAVDSCVWMWVLLGATKLETHAQKVINSRVYAKYASGTITNPNVTFDVTDGELGCAAACGSLPLCMGFSVTPNQNISQTVEEWSTCRLGFGTFEWTDDPISTLHGVDIGPLSGYAFMKDGRFYKKYTQKLIYAAALKACEAEGAAAVDAYGQQAYGIVRSLMPPETQLILGMYRNSNYSTGRWVTFRGIEFVAKAAGDTNQLWMAGEPSFEQCVAMGTTNNDWSLPLNWDADGCERDVWPLPRICHKPLGYERARNGKYYKMHYHLTGSNDEAQKICASEGGNLANMFTQGNFDAIAGYRVRAKFATDGFRVGGTDKDHEGTWTLPDGSAILDYKQIPNWAAPEPSNSNGEEHCLAYDEQRDGLNDVKCSSPYNKFLCEIVA